MCTYGELERHGCSWRGSDCGGLVEERRMIWLLDLPVVPRSFAIWFFLVVVWWRWWFSWWRSGSPPLIKMDPSVVPRSFAVWFHGLRHVRALCSLGFWLGLGKFWLDGGWEGLQTDIWRSYSVPQLTGSKWGNEKQGEKQGDLCRTIDLGSCWNLVWAGKCCRWVRWREWESTL